MLLRLQKAYHSFTKLFQSVKNESNDKNIITCLEFTVLTIDYISATSNVA